MKKIYSIVFLFIILNLFLSLDVKAFELNGMIDYIETQKNISKVKTTIIPNQSIVETKDGIKLVSNDIVNTLNMEDTDLTFVIGEERACSSEDYEWLLKIVQCEAGGEDEIGKILVANVIFNRLDTGRYGDSLYSVIFAHNQFSPVGSGSIYKAKPSEATIEAVKKAMDGVDYSQGALFFMNRAASGKNNVTWFDTKLTWLFKYGGHEFFK